MSARVGSNALNNPVLGSTSQGTDAVGPGTSTGWLPCVAAAILGILIVMVVGFAPDFAHQAAHDVRHSMAFPCH